MKSYYWLQYDKSPIRISFATKPSPIKPHSQKELELMYFYETTGCVYECRGNTLNVNKGELITINPDEMHACNGWGENICVVCVIIDVEKLLPNCTKPLYFKNLISHPDVSHAFEKLKQNMENNDENSLIDCYVYSFVYEILAILIKNEFQNEYDSDLYKDELLSVSKYIMENISDKISIKMLADKMHLSESRFYHVFKNYFGLSPKEYILRCRISKSCTLLSGGSLRITDIAQECGFCSASYFTEIFGKHMNCTPKEYRIKMYNAERERISHLDKF